MRILDGTYRILGLFRPKIDVVVTSYLATQIINKK